MCEHYDWVQTDLVKVIENINQIIFRNLNNSITMIVEQQLTEIFLAVQSNVFSLN